MSRLRHAIRVLFGARPAEVRFDAADAGRALVCSQVAADAIIAGVYMGLLPEDVEDRMWTLVQREVHEALLAYAGRGRLPAPAPAGTDPFGESPS